MQKVLALQVVTERFELWIGGEHRREIAGLHERERWNRHLSRTRFLALVGVVDGWGLVLDEEFLLD